MIFKKKYNINNVWFSPVIIESMIYYVEYPSKKIFWFDYNSSNNFDGLEFYSINKWNNYYITDNLVFFNYKAFNVDNKINILNLFNEPIALFFSIILDNETIIVKEIDEKNEKVMYHLINVINNSKKKLEIINPKLVINSYIISSKNPFLLAYKISDSTELWRLDIAEIGKYLRVGDKEETNGSISCMEVYKNTLVVLLTNGLYLGINIENGNIIWQQKLPYGTTWPAFHDGKFYHLSPYNDYYAIIDMETGAIEKEIKDLETTFIRHGFFTNPAIYEDIFAITSQDGVIYLLDKNTAEIKSSISLGLNEKNNTVSIDNIPQIHGNRLYQLDGDKTLHIFEKE